MNLSKLRGKVKRHSRRSLRRGDITEYQHRLVMAVCADEDALDQLNEQIEAEINPWSRPDGLVGAGFKEWLSNAWDWVKEHWPEILALILKLAPLLLILDEEDD